MTGEELRAPVRSLQWTHRCHLRLSGFLRNCRMCLDPVSSGVCGFLSCGLFNILPLRKTYLNQTLCAGSRCSHHGSRRWKLHNGDCQVEPHGWRNPGTNQTAFGADLSSQSGAVFIDAPGQWIVWSVHVRKHECRVECTCPQGHGHE